LVLAETQFANDREEHYWECEIDSGHFLSLNLEFDEQYEDPEIGLIESGFTTLHASDAFVSDSKAVIRDIPKLTRKPITHQRRLSTIGTRTVLVVRVKANDATTSAAEDDLAREVFGITDSNGNSASVNLSNTFAQCSYNKLTFEPSSDSDGRGNNGVYTVSINDDIVGQRNVDVRNVVLDQLRSDFGSNDLNALYDHIMVCMPHGTLSKSGQTDSTDWAASATINGYVSFYNDNWCMSTSAQMHEIGHNLGLKHSNESGSTYEDNSGMMGHSYFDSNSPLMCFNTAKNWQLGWYQDRHTTVQPLHDEFWQGRLIGYVDYMNHSAPSSDSVIVKVEGHIVDYFIGFNVRSGMNKQNQEIEALNKITVHSVSTLGGKSSLVAKLSAGETFEIANFAGGLHSAMIQVENINLGVNPPVAHVSVNIMSCTSDSDCDDGDECTTNSCNISTGICNHAPNINCFDLMRTELLTDKYPKETHWNIVDNCNHDAVVMLGSGYTTKFETYGDSANLPPSKYTLEIKDAYGDGICCGQGLGSFKVFHNDAEIYSGGKFKKREIYTWGSCPILTISSLETIAPTASPSNFPSAMPSDFPSVTPPCDITYELIFETPSSSSQTTSWMFAYDETTSIIPKSSSQTYSSGSTYIERGCLKSNCYNFSINDAENYNLTIDGVSIASSDSLVNDELSLFGTCETILL